MQRSSGGLWAVGYRSLTLGVLLAVILVAFETLAVSAVMPAVAQQLQGTDLYGWAFSLFLLANILGIFWAGVTADRRGVWLPMAGAFAVFAAGLLVAGIATTMPTLLAGRMLQGFGAGGIVTLVYVIVQQAYPSTLRAAMLAALASAWIVPTLVGPLAASWMAQTLGWRSVFLAMLPLLLGVFMTFGPLRRLGPSQATYDPQRFWWAALLAMGTALLLASLGQPQKLWPLGLVGLALMILSLPKLLPAGMWLARPGLPAALLLRGLLYGVFAGIEIYLPLALFELRQLPLQGGALALMAGSLSWSAGAWLQARLEQRYALASRPLRTVLGLALVFLGLLLVSAAALWLNPAVLLAALGWVVGGFGMGLVFTTLTLQVFDRASMEQRGQTSSWLQCADVLFGAILAGGLGAVLAVLRAGGNIELAFAAVFALVVLAAGVGLWLSPRSWRN